MPNKMYKIKNTKYMVNVRTPIISNRIILPTHIIVAITINSLIDNTFSHSITSAIL